MIEVLGAEFASHDCDASAIAAFRKWARFRLIPAG
jgi:hypothetical protein